MDFSYFLLDQSEVFSSFVSTTARIQNSDLLAVLHAKWKSEKLRYFRLRCSPNFTCVCVGGCVCVCVCVCVCSVLFGNSHKHKMSLNQRFGQIDGSLKNQ